MVRPGGLGRVHSRVPALRKRGAGRGCPAITAHPAGQQPLRLAVPALLACPLWPSPCWLSPWAPLSVGPRVLALKVASSGRSNRCSLWPEMLCSSSCVLNSPYPCVCPPGSVCPGLRLTILLVAEQGTVGPQMKTVSQPSSRSPEFQRLLETRNCSPAPSLQGPCKPLYQRP